jgi:hypothetical protein
MEAVAIQNKLFLKSTTNPAKAAYNLAFFSHFKKQPVPQAKQNES